MENVSVAKKENQAHAQLKSILSPPGPFLTPSPSPSVQHSPRLQSSPSQSPFQQDVLLVTNNSQHFINTFNTTQEQDRKSGTTPNRRLSLNHISPNAGTIVYRPSPTQSPANIANTTNVGNEFNTTLVGSNNISLNKKGKRTPQHAGQYGMSPNSCSPKTTKKAMGHLGSPIASPSPSPTLNSQPIMQQFPIMNSNNSIVFMQQPAPSQRPSIIQTSNTHQSNVYTTSNNSVAGTTKQNKAPQQILPKPAAQTVGSHSQSSLSNPSIITNATSTKQIMTQSKMAIVHQSNHILQSPPHQSQQLMSHGSAGSSPSPQPHQISQAGSILLPSGSQPLLLNQMPVLVQQNTPQGVQLILRPPSAPQLGAPGLVIQNRPTQMQQHQPQQLLRILNTNGAMQLTTANSTPTFIVSSQANLIQQNLQGMKTSSNGSSQVNQISGIQQSHQQTQRQPQQIMNSHILGQSVAQIQNLQLNGNLTQIQMPNGINGQFIQQLPAQFQNMSGFNNIQPMGSQITALGNATFQSTQSSNNAQNDIVSTSTSNQIQFTNQQNTLSMAQGSQIISPVATPQPHSMQSDQSILSSSPSFTFNTQPQTAVILTSDKHIHGMSSPPPHTTNYSIIHQSGTTEMITLDMSQHQQQQNIVATKPARKPKKSKKQKALEHNQLQEQQLLQNRQQQQIHMAHAQPIESPTMMMSPPRNSQAPTGKLDLANVMKLCGIMEDDDFMDTDEGIESSENQSEQSQSIHIPSNAHGGENNTTDIMITFPGGSADQPFTFTIPSSSLENAEGGLIQSPTNDSKMSVNNVPFMIRFDPSDDQNSGQPYTISIPNMSEDPSDNKGGEMVSSTANLNVPTSMSVPSFVNSVLNSSVTPTIQSQINEIQNQLMAMPPVTTSKVTARAPKQKKQTTKKTKKQLEKTLEVPTQIGNIQISQIDGTTMKSTLGNKNINNQIQIMPILEKCQSGGNNHIIEKQKMHVPVMQHTIAHHNNNQNNNQQQHHHHQQNNSRGSHSNSGPSQVNINVQQNQLINVTNNLQMQVISNPQQQQHNSGATPAHAPTTSSSSGHQTQQQNSVVTTQSLNTQNLIGNIINAQQGQSTGNIIIQSSAFNPQQQQTMPANIQVNIQNQTIANNIITTAPVNQNHMSSNNQQNQQQPSAQSVLSQLTGNLVLSLSEDGRLILRHDPNIPQDAQSQMILQTILTGALGNVSLINEPLKTQMPTQNTQNQHVINANGKIQHMSSVQNKNLIINTQSQPQQMFNNVVQSHTMPSHVIQNAPQQIQVQSQKIETSNIQHQQQQVVLPNPNILKFVELPKIQANQQLFSLNTMTNEITQLNPNQTTAALSPMERLLIVPSGINAQQLAQCLSQGQIHFNNIGQAPTTDINKVQQQLQVQQQQQILLQQQVAYKTPNVQKVNHFIKKEPVEPKPKKGRGKKAKLLEEHQKIEIKKDPVMIQSPPPMKMISLADSKIIKTPSITTSAVTTPMNSIAKNTITISPNPSLITSSPKITAKAQLNNIQKTNLKQNSITFIPTPKNAMVQKQNAIKAGKNQQIKSAMTPQLSPIIAQQAPPPPLVSVNQAPIPRVQTIQLTPQKQQSLKNVQMSIQQLSAKLQNKNLLATLSADVDPNNPVHNNPLPILNNINGLTDSEIYNALQRLFVEQQKILATGKIIPTIPAAAAAAVSPQIHNSSMLQPSRVIQNSAIQTQPIFSNNSSIAPITSSTSLYCGGNVQTITSPIVKQEVSCPTTTSISQPPPLVVSSPIQMQIKTELLLSPGGGAPTVTTTSPLATGSIIISPKYTMAQKIIIDPPKEQNLIVDSKKNIIIQPVIVTQAPDVSVDRANVIKHQQKAATIEANRKLKITRSSLFEHQMNVDQEGCIRPDYKNDFCSKEDAVKRLIRYHCLYDEIKEEHDPKEDYEFEEQAKVFFASYNAMQKKYQQLILKQSQQHAPTSELMMLDRLRVADLKDEIVSMQSELNTVLFEQHQKTQMTIKSEVASTLSTPVSVAYHHSQRQPSPANIFDVQPIVQTSQNMLRIQQNVSTLKEPSQILKAKQEKKLFENIQNDRVKVEVTEVQKEPTKSNFGNSPSHLNPCQISPSPKSPDSFQQNSKHSKFDKLKNEPMSIVGASHQSRKGSHSPKPHLQSPNLLHKSQPNVKTPIEMKQELDDFDIETEIRPNLIMKKCESVLRPTLSISQNIGKKQSKTKEKEREFSPLSDYFNTKSTLPPKNKSDSAKIEANDGTYDEWVSIQKELNLQLSSSSSGSSKKKDGNLKLVKCNSKLMDNELSEIFEHQTSPKSVEKQLDDLFSSSNKSNDMLASASPLTEFFQSDTSSLSEKTVENRLEALFGASEEDSTKLNQQDLVETHLEQLFQGSVAENDESALDSASFLYKNDITYDMIQKQILPENGNESNAIKRQWSGTCDIFASTNSSMLFPASTSASKRACISVPSVAFDNKWIEESFDFASEIMSTESSGDDLTKHRSWNGSLEHQETMIGGIQSPHHSIDANQFNLPSNVSSNIQQHQMIVQNLQPNEHLNLMDTQIPSLNYDDVDDISRQVQNAIDSILNLQSSDPLHYQLESSFLELNTITAPSGAPNSPVNHQQSQSHPTQNQHLNYQMQPRTDHQMHPLQGFSSQKPLNTPKRKYSRMDDIGDCLIGGSNLDDSPSGLALSEPHGIEPSSASVGEFVNNLLNCEEKSITTS